MKNNHIHLYKLSNTETYNKFLLTVSSVAFGFIYNLIVRKQGWVLGLKITMVLFAASITLTMLALIITSDYPQPKGCLNIFIDIVDWAAFVTFVAAIVLICISAFMI